MKLEKQRITPLLFTVYLAAASGRSSALPCLAAFLVLSRFVVGIPIYTVYFSDPIVMSLYNGFASLTNAIPTSTDLIPTKPLDMIAFYIERTPMPAGSDPNGSDWSPFWWTFNRNDRHDVFDFKPLIYNIKIIIQGFIMQIIMIITSVIVIARYFELTVYTIIAPIPLSTLACEGMTDIGKGFLKSYAAVCIQAIVLIIMFFVYATLKSAIPVNGAIESWGGLIYTFVLAAAVMQSGSWAKKICGAM